MNIPPPSSPGTAPTNIRYVILGWACSLSMLTYIDRVCVKLVSSDMQRDLDIDARGFGYVFAAFGLAYALFEVPSGWLGDRFGPRLVLCRIVLWWSFFTALTGCIWQFSYDLGYSIPNLLPRFVWSEANWLPASVTWDTEAVPLVFSSLVLLVIVRFLFGMGEAGAYPVTARALRNWFPYSRRGQAQGALWTFGRWGGALAPFLVVAFQHLCGWRGTFLLFGILGALWVVFFGYFFRNTPADHPGVNAAERAYIQEKGDEHARLPISWRSMLRSPTLWCLCGMYLCSNAGWCFFITWDKKYYENVLELDNDTAFLGLGISELTIANSAPLFFGGIACFLGGFLTDRQVRIWGPRWGRTLQGFIAYFCGGCFYLLAYEARAVPALSVTFLCMASFCKDFAMAVSWSTCIDVGHRYSGTVAGFMNGLGNLGTFFAPLIVSGLVEGEGENWNLVLLFYASMFFLACGCWLFINPRKVIVYSKADRELLRAQGAL